MNRARPALNLFPELYAVVRLDPTAPLPYWLPQDFFSITRTQTELSIVCRQESVPKDVRQENDWRCLQVEGPLDFSWTGIIADLTLPLADAGIPVFFFSTFDTDYLLVKKTDLGRTLQILSQEGHQITVCNAGVPPAQLGDAQ